MKRIFKSLFDYEIVGEYYEREPQRNGTVTRKKKYLKKWFCVPVRAYQRRKERANENT